MSTPSLEERFSSKVEVRGPLECWPWRGARDPDGYGWFSNGRVMGSRRSNRVAWAIANGPIPPGMIVMHICDNPPCCNPVHLLLGTVAENNADRGRKGRTAATSKTACLRGHPFDEANTRLSRGKRNCRECNRAKWRNAARDARALALALGQGDPVKEGEK